MAGYRTRNTMRNRTKETRKSGVRNSRRISGGRRPSSIIPQGMYGTTTSATKSASINGSRFIPKVKNFGSSMGKNVKTFGRSARYPVGMAAIGIGIAGMATKWALNQGNSFMRSAYPNSHYPQGSGQYGFRSGAKQGTPGIAGLRFQFRRK